MNWKKYIQSTWWKKRFLVHAFRISLNLAILESMVIYWKVQKTLKIRFRCRDQMCWGWLVEGDGSPLPPPQRYQISKKHLISNNSIYIPLWESSVSLAHSHVFRNRICQQLIFLITIKCHDTPSFPRPLMSLNNLEVMFILDCMACFTPTNTKLPSIEHLLNVSVFNVSNP